MVATSGIRAWYRKPQDLEQCWQCTTSGELFVYTILGVENDSAARRARPPRCPCHQRLMRRYTAPWHGCPAWASRALFAGISLYSVWTLLSAFCFVPGLPFLRPSC